MLVIVGSPASVVVIEIGLGGVGKILGGKGGVIVEGLKVVRVGELIVNVVVIAVIIVIPVAAVAAVAAVVIAPIRVGVRVLVLVVLTVVLTVVLIVVALSSLS